MDTIRQLGRYEIISELGQGAMGVVYKATDPLIDRGVAIKTINLGLALEDRDEYEGRFYQEAKAAGRLSHPNIVTIYDVGKSGDVAYIAMEFLQGRELREILNDSQTLPVERVLDIVIQVALGLTYAHEHGIVHRDVKPANVMVGADGHVKITDFGIARMESASVRTQTGMILGSPKYMSPEQVMGKVIDQRSDIFSLGVMLYEMLTGKTPFGGENINAIMYQTLNSIPPPPGSVNPAVPDMLNYISAKALAKGLDDRYQCAKDFVDDLRACRDSLLRSTSPLIASQCSLSGADANAIVKRIDEGDQPTEILALGVSTSFDSFGATMRLAALTVSSEEVDALSKTFKMSRPSRHDHPLEAAQSHSPAPVSASSTSNSPPQEKLPADNGASPANTGLIFSLVAVLVSIALLVAILY
jgi:serine/threonine-protein kinase